MTSQNKSRSKSNSKVSKISKKKQSNLILSPIQSMENQVLSPIYDKVELIRQQLNKRQPLKKIVSIQKPVRPQTREVFIDIGVDRNEDIVNQRKKHNRKYPPEEKNLRGVSSQRKISTSSNWREHHKNQTQRLVKFLQNNKKDPLSARQKQSETKKSRFSVIERNVQNEEMFEPVGRLYQESIRGSQTQSLSSFRQESSLQSSKIRSINSKDSSSKKYLRKGTRVREILMKQLQSPQQRSGTPSSMTYLKDYDQWVPTSLVEQKKAELQTFMSIIYGEKKYKGSNLVDLDQIHLVYL